MISPLNNTRQSMKIIALFLLLAGTASAQAWNEKQNLDLPFIGIVRDCANSTREPLAISGIVHVDIHLYHNPSLKYGVDAHWRIDPETKVIGMETGTQYKLLGQTFTRYSFEPSRMIRQVTEVNNFRIPEIGFDVHWVNRLNFYYDELGFFKSAQVLVDKLDERCTDRE